MMKTISPATWWLYSLHCRSASFRGASRSDSGMSSRLDEVKDGTLGVNTWTTSASVARSLTTSTAGGSDVREAAAKSTVMPSPSSTSTKRRRRSSETSSADGSRRTTKKLSAPSTRMSARIVILVATIMP